MSSLELRAALFRGFADRSRLAILATLVGGSRRVTDVVEATGLSQSNVSGHLACLWDCGLVARERRGREIHYALVPGVAELLSAADAVSEQAGDTMGACPRYGTRAVA
jgi:DNA-binding transcriptional ArsR family regulator